MKSEKINTNELKAQFHLPGLFEFYELYKLVLPLFYEHREYFYEWCDIGSVYGAPADCIWGGGRIEVSDVSPEEVLSLVNGYGISARLTFSNSLISQEHLADSKCNKLCKIFQRGENDKHSSMQKNGIVIYSDLLLDYIRSNYPQYYFVSSTTKVITEFDGLCDELNREEYAYVVPDFRLNKEFDLLATLDASQKGKIELLCNECCYFGCTDRKKCYENVSRRALGESVEEHRCCSPDADKGYVFSKAMENPGFISIETIRNKYLPLGISNFKIEGRSLGSAMILEFLLYYMTKPECQLKVREAIYLDGMLDLF